MKVGIMQPYFMPYLGYWQLIKAVDKYVVYDDVQYIKGGWISRNNILMNGQKKLFTISLSGASPNKLINNIFIGDNFKKFKGTLQCCYSKAPFYRPTMTLLEDIISFPDKQLGLFLLHSFEVVLRYLDIDTDIILSSCLKKNNELRAQEKVIHICNLLGADCYYNAIGGQNLYEKSVFASSGVDLRFLKPNLLPYRQYNNEFVAGLSMIDILMFNSPDEINSMLDNYELI